MGYFHNDWGDTHILKIYQKDAISERRGIPRNNNSYRSRDDGGAAW